MASVPFSNTEIFLLIGTTIAGVLFSVALQFPLVIGFLPGFIVLLGISKRKKYTHIQILKVCVKGIQKTRIVIMILLLVSFVLPSWYLSGTIGQMVSLSIQWITPDHFLVFSFITAMIFSMVLGTSVGTLSSIGVPIIGTAHVFHIPAAIAAGALISGAFVGDRTSPFSSSHQLLANTIETSVGKQFKAMFITTVMAILIVILFYGVFDIHHSQSAGRQIAHNKPEVFSYIKMLPPFILVLVVMARVSIVYAFLSSIITAVAIAFTNGTGFMEIMKDLWFGVNGLGGGFIHMYELLLFLALAGAYNGLIEDMNVIQPYLDNWLKTSRSFFSDTMKMMAATLIISMIAANQTLPIILTGRSFLPIWRKKYGKSEMARVMADSTMLFPGMVPWSVLAIMCSTILGIPLFQYLPYAMFLWILPILTLGVSFFKQLNQGPKTTSTFVE